MDNDWPTLFSAHWTIISVVLPIDQISTKFKTFPDVFNWLCYCHQPSNSNCIKLVSPFCSLICGRPQIEKMKIDRSSYALALLVSALLSRTMTWIGVFMKYNKKFEVISRDIVLYFNKGGADPFPRILSKSPAFEVASLPPGWFPEDLHGKKNPVGTLHQR